MIFLVIRADDDQCDLQRRRARAEQPLRAIRHIDTMIARSIMATGTQIEFPRLGRRQRAVSRTSVAGAVTEDGQVPRLTFIFRRRFRRRRRQIQEDADETRARQLRDLV